MHRTHGFHGLRALACHRFQCRIREDDKGRHMLFGRQCPPKLAQGFEKAVPAFAVGIKIPLDRCLFHRILCAEGKAVDLCLPRKDFFRFVRQLEYGIGLSVTEEVAIRDEAVQRTLDMAQLLKRELAESRHREEILLDELLGSLSFKDSGDDARSVSLAEG